MSVRPDLCRCLKLNVELSELEQAFRNNWRDFAPQRYAEFLDQTSGDNRLELLARILSAELEFAFQPPSRRSTSVAGKFSPLPKEGEQPGKVLGTSNHLMPENDNPAEDDSDDDQRVKPCVPLFLLRFPELANRPELVIRLIVLEYALRLRYDRHPPNPESYLPLCQQQTDQLIRLLELTESKLPLHRSTTAAAEEISHSDSTVKESSLSESITLDPLPLNLGCFLLLRLLGRGGMGYVHAAIDLRSTAQVAVKVMRRIDAWSIYRFIEEFRWLSQLSHPNLVKLYDAFCEGDVRYFSMELVEGKSVREWFRKFPFEQEVRWRELRRVLGQLASAIDYLHEHQVLHCDIKCSNMMIASGSRAVLLDLGLAVRAGQENRLVGTLQYMAPEVIAGGSATFASDWYSFGVMIYEVLTDNFPPIQIDLTQASQSGGAYCLDVEQLRHNLRECPVDLKELCVDLLHPEPSARPSRSQVVERLKGRSARPQWITGSFECAGREVELSTIDTAVRLPSESLKPTRPRASLVILEGESGSGKSTLLQYWTKSLDERECLLLSVRCYRQDHTPVRLLNALVQELTTALPRLPESRWKPTLEKQVSNMRLMFPQVQQLIPELIVPAKHMEASSKSGHGASHDVSTSSFVQWLLELSHQQRLIICVDDAQWADFESLRTLRRLLNHVEHFHGAMLLVDESGSHRLTELLQPEERMHASQATAFELTHIPLAPLTSTTCLQLLGRWAASVEMPINASVANDIVRRSSGNPFLLQEIFRTYVHYTENGDISGSDWLVTDSHNSVRRRFSMLPQPTENILQFLAVADHAMNFHQLQMVSRILPHELQRTLSLLASQGWIRSRGGELESDVEIAHENFRRAIEQSIPADRLHRRHYRLARILSCETPPPWARVADHYWSAEYFREASSCYLEAARSAIASGGNVAAIEFLRRADHPQAQRTPAEQSRVTRMKADCLAKVGNSQLAAELYESLLQQELAAKPTDEKQVTILRCLSGEQRIRAGQLEPGLKCLELALKQLGITSWKKSAFSQLCLALKCYRLGWNGLRPKPKATQSKLASAPFTEMERSLNRLSPALTFLDNELGPDVILRMTRLAEIRGTNFDRALAILRSAILLSFGGSRQRLQAAKRLRLGRQLARASQAEEALATADFCMFVWHIQRGRMAAAARSGHAALSLYRNCPSDTQWEQHFLQWALLGTYWSGFQLTELRHSTTLLRQSARDRCDPMSLFWTHVDAAHWADLVNGQVEHARTSLHVASEAIVDQDFQSPRFFLWQTRIHQALYENDTQRAREMLEQDWPRLSRSLIMRTNHYRWLALCARLRCDLLELRQHQPPRANLLRDARRCVQQMSRLEEPVFVLYAEAFSLVVEANYGDPKRDHLPPAIAWESTIEKLHQLEHHLMAVAVQWHFSYHAPDNQRSQLRGAAQAAFARQECIAPDKLLNTIIPLPVQ